MKPISLLILVLGGIGLAFPLAPVTETSLESRGYGSALKALSKLERAVFPLCSKISRASRSGSKLEPTAELSNAFRAAEREAIGAAAKSGNSQDLLASIKTAGAKTLAFKDLPGKVAFEALQNMNKKLGLAAERSGAVGPGLISPSVNVQGKTLEEQAIKQINNQLRKAGKEVAGGSGDDGKAPPKTDPDLNEGTNRERGQRLSRMWYRLEKARRPEEDRVQSGQSKLLEDSTWNPWEGRWYGVVFESLARDWLFIVRYANLEEPPAEPKKLKPMPPLSETADPKACAEQAYLTELRRTARGVAEARKADKEDGAETYSPHALDLAAPIVTRCFNKERTEEVLTWAGDMYEEQTTTAQ